MYSNRFSSIDSVIYNICVKFIIYNVLTVMYLKDKNQDVIFLFLKSYFMHHFIMITLRHNKLQYVTFPAFRLNSKVYGLS